MFVGYTFFEFHPWFVCTMPDRDGQMVIVSATDASKAFDLTCVIEPREHESITKRSAVYYDLAVFRAVESFERRLKHNTIQPRAPASDALMTRIRQGAVDSPHTPREIRRAILLCPWKPGSDIEGA